MEQEDWFLDSKCHATTTCCSWHKKCTWPAVAVPLLLEYFGVYFFGQVNVLPPPPLISHTPPPPTTTCLILNPFARPPYSFFSFPSPHFPRHVSDGPSIRPPRGPSSSRKCHRHCYLRFRGRSVGRRDGRSRFLVGCSAGRTQRAMRGRGRTATYVAVVFHMPRFLEIIAVPR